MYNLTEKLVNELTTYLDMGKIGVLTPEGAIIDDREYILELDDNIFRLWKKEELDHDNLAIIIDDGKNQAKKDLGGALVTAPIDETHKAITITSIYDLLKLEPGLEKYFDLKEQGEIVYFENNFEEKEFNINSDKIQKHIVEPKKLKIFLSMDDPETVHPPRLEAYLWLEEYSRISKSIKEWSLRSKSDQDAAMKEYEEMLDMIKEEKYILHLYDNGKIELEFLNNDNIKTQE